MAENKQYKSLNGPCLCQRWWNNMLLLSLGKTHPLLWLLKCIFSTLCVLILLSPKSAANFNNFFHNLASSLHTVHATANGAVHTSQTVGKDYKQCKHTKMSVITPIYCCLPSPTLCKCLFFLDL